MPKWAYRNIEGNSGENSLNALGERSQEENQVSGMPSLGEGCRPAQLSLHRSLGGQDPPEHPLHHPPLNFQMMFASLLHGLGQHACEPYGQ